MSTHNPRVIFEQNRRQAHLALRAGRAATAERVLRALAAQAPTEPNTQWLLGVALLDQDRLTEGTHTLEALLATTPDFASARVDLARAYRQAGRAAQARQEVRRVLEKMPHHHLAWLAYADVLVDLEQFQDARVAFERARLTDQQLPRIEKATSALLANDRKSAESIFREILQVDPGHVAALVGVATLSMTADKPHDAERLLRHALKQAAHLPLAWRELGPVLISLGRLEEADKVAGYLMRIEPENPQTWINKATVATRLMRQEDALEAYEHALRLKPHEARLRMSIGHTQKTLGRRAAAEASYKAALALDPGLAEAYWSLADLKNYAFGEAEVAVMQQLLERDPRDRNNESQLNFALGKAFEQRQRYQEAFAYYARGNALRRLDAPFDIEHFERRSERIRTVFNESYFAERAGSGDPSRAPIFIVGLPRSGSTLVEQILASHSQVEGTMELPNIINLTHWFDDMAADSDGYPETVVRIPSTQLASLGTRYLGDTRPLRSGRDHFTDKLPNNFSHVGLIHSILPGATIIDARRHPMDSCFSTFKQHFAMGQAFSYDLNDLGRYYRAYLSLMDHWQRVLPGKVLCLQYEDLVRHPEFQIRRLLTHCGLPFESACVNFHQTQRSVRTASAEQVRQPIYASGVGYWRHFSEELEPLRRALGDALARFP